MIVGTFAFAVSLASTTVVLAPCLSALAIPIWEYHTRLDLCIALYHDAKETKWEKVETSLISQDRFPHIIPVFSGFRVDTQHMGKDTFPWVQYIFPCAGCHSHQD
jgi:hypothetical protein